MTERIRSGIAGFSPAERKVARALLAGPPTVGLEPSARLARHIGVSGPTVIRFANRLGFARYGDFQDALRQELNARMLSPVTVYRQLATEGAGSGELLESAAATLGDAVTRTLRDLPPDEFSRAVELLNDPSRRLIVFGGWFSHVLARHLAAVLQEMRPGVRLIEQTASQRAAAIVEVKAKDVAVIFDYRRYEEDTVAFARAVHDAGARVVLLTDRWLSPVAEIADVVLPAVVDGKSPFDTLTPALAIVDVLAVAVVNNGGEAARSRFERFSDVANRLAPKWGASLDLHDSNEGGSGNADSRR